MAALASLALFAQVVISPDVEQLAAEHGIDPVDLAGATFTTGLDPHIYLCEVGEGPCPSPPLNAAVERRLDCISWQESRDTPSATNPRTGAAGLFQFLRSTWAGTPQGRAGRSPYDPGAAREAARWMVGQGRIGEWSVVTAGLC